MPVVLSLLADVRWRGQPVVGERPQALLAALSSGRTVRTEDLVQQVWSDDVPANPGKALQVLVSRTRAVCGVEAVTRVGDGYRLGLRPDEVDAQLLAAETAAARTLLAPAPAAAAEHARAAVALGQAMVPALDDAGPLSDVRRAAARDLRTARRVLAQASSRVGAHADGLPFLEAEFAAT